MQRNKAKQILNIKAMATTQQQQHDKFQEIAQNYFVGQIADFRHTLKRLDRAQLLRFCVYCAINFPDLDIYTIEKNFNA